MLSKKLISLVMVVAVLLTMAVIPTVFSAKNVDAADTSVNTASDYGLTGSIQTGNILHAFNWSMADLAKYAPDIAAAGYSTVQISPIQTTKPTANDSSYATDWWSFYQPVDFKIGNALGTEAELKTAINALHSNGVKVIADVVTNHLPSYKTKAEWTSGLDKSIRDFARVPGSPTATTYMDNTRLNQTTTDLGGLKDINTENKTYQNYVINNLLLPLIDDGIDGFRFDAAKHIATPNDNGCSSDYWPTVTNAIREKKSDAYIYGEVLSLNGLISITNYTQFMNVTDYSYGGTVRSALNSKNASNLVNYGWTGSSKSQNVLWVESHDNFCDNTSTKLTKAQQILGWAVVGARADAPALFLVRPKHEALDSAGFIKYDELMSAPGASDTWKDPVVVAVNKFKNAFAGQGETVTASGANFFVQRGTSGMVIVNLNGSSTSINQSCSMANGTYTDQVTGNSFTVSGGKITGNVGSSGVAVVYNTTAANCAPSITLKLNGVEQTPETLNRYTGSTADITVSLKNATSGTIKVSNLDAVTVNGGDTTFKLNSSIPAGKSVDITITATNGSKTVSKSYNIKKKNANETKRVYFDNSKMKWPVVCVYCKTGEDPGTQIADYDYYKMQLVSGSTTLYYCDVPANTNYVKFNEGFIKNVVYPATDEYGRSHLMHQFSDCGGYCGRTMPETVVNYGTANEKYNRERGGYKLEGSMILTDLRFVDYGDYPLAVLSAADTTLKGTDPVTPTEQQPTTAPQPTEAPTEAPTQAPTEPPVISDKLYLGDADRDGKVTIIDATMIQRKLAGLSNLPTDGVTCGDVDKSGSLSILDVTAIQRYLADIENPYNIGSEIIPGAEPTEPPYAEPTEAPVEVGPLPNRFVLGIYCEAFSDDATMRNKEAEFDKSTGTLTYDFPGDAYVFARNYDTGVEYCTDGWTNFANPVTLVNYNTMKENGRGAYFEKMYVPAGTQTIYLIVNSDDTCTLGYFEGGEVIVQPTQPVQPDPTSAPATEPQQSSVSFLLTDNFGWGAAYVYAWDANGNALNGEWPGASQAEKIVNGYGETQFRCYVPDGAVGVILNNGKGAQTEDITDFSYTGYWMDGSKNSKGHYRVTGWNE